MLLGQRLQRAGLEFMQAEATTRKGITTAQVLCETDEQCELLKEFFRREGISGVVRVATPVEVANWKAFQDQW